MSEELFTPSPDDLLVTLELAASARWVTETYPLESVDELPDGKLLVRLRTADSRWLVRLALRLGGEATVLDPPELADRVRTTAAAALAAYA
jgi:proteasome accessory factor C